MKRPPPASVTLLDQDVFPVRAAVGQFSPAQRAEATSRKLAQLLKDPGFRPETITTTESEGVSEVVAGDVVLTTVTDQDSDFDALGRTRQKLAAAEAEAMRHALAKAINDYSAASLSLGALKAGAAGLVLVLILLGLRMLFPAIYRGIHERRGTRIRTIRIQSLELLSEERITESLVQTARLIRFALTLLLLYFFVPLLFSFFAPTRRFGRSLVQYVIAPVHRGWDALINYLPSLLVVVVVVFFTLQALKLARFLFKEIERGTIAWPGFYPEWAMPTSRIVELLLVAFALVIAFPYLPGSSSAAFRGVSIFLGVLLSLGSSTAIANVVAGVLLTYTRAFKIGDRVSIADTTGDVIEKTLLATHLRTIKNVDVTVPNGLVLASHIVNYSRASVEKPLLLNMEITLGYDTPWRRIHELLISAAKGVPGVLADPAPFVLQTALDDFYVRYQVNAATVFPTCAWRRCIRSSTSASWTASTRPASRSCRRTTTPCGGASRRRSRRSTWRSTPGASRRGIRIRPVRCRALKSKDVRKVRKVEDAKFAKFKTALVYFAYFAALTFLTLRTPFLPWAMQAWPRGTMIWFVLAVPAGLRGMAWRCDESDGCNGRSGRPAAAQGNGGQPAGTQARRRPDYGNHRV